MQRNFILTDVMKTGQNQHYEDFISMHSLPNQTFDMTCEYYTLQWYDLDAYDRKFAIIDVNHGNARVADNKEFNEELQRRLDLLKSQGFVFIAASPWESIENIQSTDQEEKVWPKFTTEHVKWTGGTSWFWYYMYKKHKGNTFNFTHNHNGSYWHKKHDFLYLNKAARPHRVELYDHLLAKGLLTNSIHTFHLHKSKKSVMPDGYELPNVDADKYPRFGLDQDIYELPYIDTVCSLVSETNDNDYDVFMTEKIWKPIIAQHVFVVHGNYLYLQKLREIGFKTFGNYFNESYDLERDPRKRRDKLVSLLQDLKAKCSEGSVVESGNKKWQDIYLQTQALRKHNYDTFFDEKKLSVQINKTLELFLEFADSRQIPS